MNVLVVDDDGIIALSLKTILEASGKITVPATGNDGEDGVKLYNEFMPDIILMDIQMKKMSGLEAAAIIKEQHPDAKILFLTTFNDDEYITSALSVGAKGYILKQDFEGIVPALLAVESGQCVFGGDIVSKIPTLSQNGSGHYEELGINEKEFQIIKLIAEGLSNKEIAGELFLSEGTVRNYLSTILEKLSLRDRTQLAVYYYKHL